MLGRQPQTLTEHGGESQPGPFHPVQGSAVGDLRPGAPVAALVTTSSDLHRGLRHSQLDSAFPPVLSQMPDQHSCPNLLLLP